VPMGAQKGTYRTVGCGNWIMSVCARGDPSLPGFSDMPRSIEQGCSRAAMNGLHVSAWLLGHYRT
jgi:hypothetical protein